VAETLIVANDFESTGLTNMDTGYARSSAQAFGGTYGLALSGGSTSERSFATYGTADGNAGAVHVTGRVKFTSSVGGTREGGVTFRVNTATPVPSSYFYYARIRWSANGTGALAIALYKSVGGTTLVASVDSESITTNAWYKVDAWIDSGNRILVRVQIEASGNYINASGGEQSTQCYAIDWTDSSSPITGSGYAGLLGASNTGGNLFFDDFGLYALTIGDVTKTASDTVGLQAVSTEKNDLPEPSATGVAFQAVATSTKDPRRFAVDTVGVAASPSQSPTWSKSAVAYIGVAASGTKASDRPASATASVGLSASPQAGLNFSIFAASAAATVSLVASPFGPADKARSSSDNFRLFDSARTAFTPVSVFASDSISLSEAVRMSGSFSYSRVASDFLSVSDSAAQKSQRTYSVSTTADLGLSDSAAKNPARLVSVAASASISIAATARPSGFFARTVSTSDSLSLFDRAAWSTRKVFSSAAVDTVRIFDTPIENSLSAVFASASFALSDIASESASLNVSVTVPLSIRPAATGGREISVSVVDNMGLSAPSAPDEYFLTLASNSGFILDAFPLAEKSARIPEIDTLSVVDSAVASVVIPSGVTIPGGDTNSGLVTRVFRDVSGTWPFSYAETPSGKIIIANGVDPMIMWNPLAGSASVAGVEPPSTPVIAYPDGDGLITGWRVAFLRFVDASGNVSSLSPVSTASSYGYSISPDDIRPGETGKTLIYASKHMLNDGQNVIISGVGGDYSSINGLSAVAVIDADTISIDKSIAGSWDGTGYLTSGASRILYRDVEVPADSKVVRRQILRNLDGTMDTLYVDIDTDDVLSSSFASSMSDAVLMQQEAVPLEDSRSRPWANRFSPPPSHKPIVCSFMGRIWAAGEVPYSAGSVSVLSGSRVVAGAGTDWQKSMAGRVMYVDGGRSGIGVAAVDEANQIITLELPYDGQSSMYSGYVIRSAPVERKLLYWSEPGQPEAWAPWSAIAVPEDGDEVTGLAVFGQALCVIEKRHIYRMVAENEPDTDGHLFLMAHRGVVNHRCSVTADGSIYMLDESGIHAYDGGESCDPISDPIQNIFHYDLLAPAYTVDWTADTTLWHASHDPGRTTIRWFVDFTGKETLTHAVCYNYRSKRWWLEQYPWPIKSSCTGVVGYRRAIVGTECRRVLALQEAGGDLAPGDGTVRGNATSVSSDRTTINDTSAAFASNLAGAPLSIVSGLGAGETRTISSNTSNSVSVVHPFSAVDTTSVYQIGGIQWKWRSGWMDSIASETQTPNDIAIAYAPVSNPNSIVLDIYYDHNPLPANWVADWTQDNVSVTAGSPDVVIDITAVYPVGGYRILRASGHSADYSYGERFVSLLFSGTSNTDSIQIYQWSITGAIYAGE
jgi:hypothetical protein